MSESILDNQIVTAEILNNIAVDLGNPTFTRFEDNASSPYAVDELNEITADLTTSGIQNSENGLLPSINTNEHIVTIGKGLAFFEDGKKKRIEEPINVDYVSGEKLYVFLLNDVANNKIELCVQPELPNISSDYVPIAEIDENENLKDIRRFTVSKTSLGSNLYQRIAMPITYTYKNINCDNMEYLEINTSSTNWNYLLYYDCSQEKNLYVEVADNDNEHVARNIIRTSTTYYFKRSGLKLLVRAWTTWDSRTPFWSETNRPYIILV